MIDKGQVKAAADEVVAAALLGNGWAAALTRLAHAAGARDAVLMRNTPDRLVVAIATEEAADAVAAFAAGQAPPSSRYAQVKSGMMRGFRIDHDDYTDDELAHDPFYQEFLRRHDVFWHANLVLTLAQDDYTEISLKRRIGAGPYERSDVQALDAVLPELRAAARLAKVVYDAETRGMARLIGRRGGMIVELDGQGRVLGDRSAGEADEGCPLRTVRRKLVAGDPTLQAALDRAIATAISPTGRLALAPLVGADGRRHVLQIHPLPDRARDVFMSAAAVAVLIERDCEPPTIRAEPSAIRDLFALTDREADVASLLAEGLDILSISGRLRITPGTARTHLKNVFGKLSVCRQAELVALIARLKP